MSNCLAFVFTSSIAVVFAIIACYALVNPSGLLGGDGVDFESFPTAGKAEVRAYYVGTAVCVMWTVIKTKHEISLPAIAILLGTFAGARVVGYCIDGVDSNADLALHQNVVFGLEVFGCATSLFSVFFVAARQNLLSEK